MPALQLLRARILPHWPVFAGFGVFFLGSFLFLLAGASDRQPIAFNHARHVENGMACDDCHSGVKTQARATLPTLATCLACHEAPLTQSAEEEKIRALAAAGKELAWVQLTRVPPHVYFSHRRHVQQGGLDCAICHGPVEKLSVPPRKPFRVLSMDACLECHERSRARTDCNDCHR
ncbi:MAG TPA: cytochrome c3 family protein [Candidatus Acidoferrales bacterium]|nr:cytochrome c3 family protein [Candidatus Acidoferrales bacterium]